LSHYMTALAMRQTGIKPASKIVLYWLADHHNSETGLCCPGIDTLAAECEMDRTTVMRHLKALESGGLIARRARFKPSGERTSDAYTLLIDPETKSQNATETKSHSARDQVAKCDSNLGRGTLEVNTHPIGCGASAPKKGFWDDCIQVLKEGGVTEPQARSLLGKWTKGRGRDQVREAVTSAAGTADPVAYLEAAFRPQKDVMAEAMRILTEGRQ